MAKYLRCHEHGANQTVGKRYKIAFEEDGCYVILNDAGYHERFTIVPDDVGDSYRNWFILETDDSANSTVGIIATKRTQLATLTAEIAQLEAQLAEESRLKVGDYARVIEDEESFVVGDVVRIERLDDDTKMYPIGAESIVSPVTYESFKRSQLTKITPAEARASLIAKIDEHFGGQEAK